MSNFLSSILADPGHAMAAVVFYCFAAVLLFAGLMVITARNPVHAVLFLILAFFNAAGLFVLLGAEFLAATLVIVYVGAVAVLFLFVVMMLDIDFASLRAGVVKHLSIGLVTAGILTAEIVMLALSWVIAPNSESHVASFASQATPNTVELGHVIYTQYVLPFEAAGLVLLVAMIGAIVLTQRERTGVRRQKVSDQLSRQAGEVVKLHHVESGKGI